MSAHATPVPNAAFSLIFSVRTPVIFPFVVSYCSRGTLLGKLAPLRMTVPRLSQPMICERSPTKICPLIVKVASQSRSLTGLELPIFPTLNPPAQAVSVPCSPRASTVPPVEGRLASAEVIHAQTSAPDHACGLPFETQGIALKTVQVTIGSSDPLGTP